VREPIRRVINGELRTEAQLTPARRFSCRLGACKDLPIDPSIPEPKLTVTHFSSKYSAKKIK
jgi:hypothetical protein